MTNFTVRLSDIDIEITSRYDSVKRFAEKYLSEAEPQFSVSVTDEQIEAEKAVWESDCADDYAESICLYREIAERLPSLDRFVFHGAAISYGGRAFLFTAPSGTGKTTHIKLWREYIGNEVDIINGDKPIIRANGGDITVYSSPWSGKEGWNKNASAPLAALCIVKRGRENRIKKISAGSAITHLIRQIYLPKSREAKLKTLTLLDRLLAEVPVFVLECDISKEAVKTSFEAMTGEEMKKEP